MAFKSVAREGADIVANRERGYAPPIVDFTAQARMLSGLILARYGVDIDIEADFFAVLMSGLKSVREAGGSKRDNRVDICGYADCGEEILTGPTLEKALVEWNKNKQE